MKKLLFTLAILFAAAIGLSAQNFRTGYFLDGYMYKYQLNPAFQGERGFLALPAIGGLSGGIETTITGTALTYPSVDGEQLLWFTDPDVPMDEFMSRIDKFNPANQSVDLNILAVGFRAKNTYHTLDFSVRGQANEYIPSDAFRLAKDLAAGTEKYNTYNLSNFSANINTYFQAAYGFSIKFKEIASIGFRAKLLLGAEQINSNLSDLRIDFKENNSTINATGNMALSPYFNDMLQNQEFSTDDETIQQLCSNPSLGAAFDFGFSVDFLKHFTLSGSVLDLGFISWNNNVLATTNGDKYFTTDDYKFSFDDEKSNNFEDEIERLGNGLVGLYELENAGDQGKRTTALAATLNLGVEYILPAYDKLSFGLMNSTRFQGDHTWTEFRLSANIAPVKIFSAGVNVAAGSYGCAFGWILNFHPNGFNLFVGMDQTLGKVTKEFVPLTSKGSVNLGVNIPF